MKFRIFFIICCFLFVSLYFILNTKKIAHVYIDPASTASVFQMADFVKQPKSEPKYIFWERFQHFYEKNFLCEYSAYAQTVALNEKPYQVLEKGITSFYKNNKDRRFIIHLNLHWARYHLKMIEGIIPKNQIVKVYLYDDSVGRMLWEGWNKIYDDFVRDFPVVFCFSYKDEVLKRKPFLKKRDIQEVNFELLANQLSSNEKELIYKLTDFNKNDVESILKNKDFAVFVDDPNLSIKETFEYFDNLLKDKPELKDMIWFYKQHPRAGAFGEAFDLLKERVAGVYLLPIQLPFEVLMLAGFNPKYVIGYGSSVFFSLKREQVLGYVKRKDKFVDKNKTVRVVDAYFNHLKSLGILDEGNVVLPLNEN